MLANPLPHTIFVHVVTWNNVATIAGCIDSVRSQRGFELGRTLHLHITDNGSNDGTVEILGRISEDGISVTYNADNLGFSGGQNQGISIALKGTFCAVLVLNPDVRLESDTVAAMVAALDDGARIGMVTPKLVRANEKLETIDPPVLDAAGMALYPSIRHLDRGSGEPDRGQFDKCEEVFGGTGACLLMSRRCIEELAVPHEVAGDTRLFSLYPQLESAYATRIQLFDEGFFAYREDADLAWRARIVGWKCRYVPHAIAAHVRRVVPERRSELPPELNLYGVRNRFLLQLNNWSFDMGVRFFVEGVLVRNALVVAGVVMRERTSLPAFRQIAQLARRAIRIRRYVFNVARKPLAL